MGKIMSSFRGGLKGAAEMLAGLDTKSQLRILEEIALKDANLAEELKKNIITIDDLTKLTPKMMAELMGQIDVKDLGLALRVSQNEVKGHFLNHLPKSLRQEVESVLLGPPQSISKVEEATERIMSVVREKVSKGEIVLRDDGEEYV